MCYLNILKKIILMALYLYIGILKNEFSHISKSYRHHRQAYHIRKKFIMGMDPLGEVNKYVKHTSKD